MDYMDKDPEIRGLNTKTSRRDFMKLSGILLTGAAIRPLDKASRIIKPETMAHSKDPQLRMLSRFERKTNLKINSMMMFVGFPESIQDAVNAAATMSASLKEWANFGIKPLVIMEPTTNGGQNLMNIENFHNSANYQYTKAYFDELKNDGVTDEQMGTWVPFPEPNLPEWAGAVTDPNIFAQNVTDVAQLIKGTFPNAAVSIYLDNQTFPNGDVNWSSGTMAESALAPYVTAFGQSKGYYGGLIESFGFQGFPWNNTDDPAEYLNSGNVISLT